MSVEDTETKNLKESPELSIVKCRGYHEEQSPQKTLVYVVNLKTQRKLDDLSRSTLMIMIECAGAI